MMIESSSFDCNVMSGMKSGDSVLEQLKCEMKVEEMADLCDDLQNE